MKSSVAVIFLFLVSCTASPPAGMKVNYQVDGKPYQGYLVRPTGDAPLILLIHDWDGLTGYEMKRANMLARLGYAVFAADLFGAGIRPTKIDEKRKRTGDLYKDREELRSRLHGALAAAKSNACDVKNAVALGYCFGGTAVLELARSGADLRGFVSFHGGLSTPKDQDYAKTKGKLLVLHGTADANISMDQFAALAQVLEKRGISHEMITYSGAPHAFSVFGSERYREEADRLSWQRFTAFLTERLTKK